MTEPQADWLVLADCSALPPPPAFPALLDRLGLLIEAADTGPVLRFGGTAIHLAHGAGTVDEDGHVVGIGEVSVAGSADGQALTLRLMEAAADRNARVQQAQHLCVVAAMIGTACAAERLFWPPAGLWSPVAALADAVAVTQEQGVPPVLHLVAFVTDGEAVRTRGLAHFCDVEFRMPTDAALTPVEAIRRLARLAVHAMIVGAVGPGASLAGLEPGEVLVIGRGPEINRVPHLQIDLRRERR